MIGRGALYRGAVGQWTWLAHRISGVAIFLFLFVHVLDTAVIRISPAAYDQVIGMYHQPIMAIGEAVLVAAVTFHALNGIRIILIDSWGRGAELQQVMFYALLAIFAITMAVFMYFHFSHTLFASPSVEEARIAVSKPAGLSLTKPRPADLYLPTATNSKTTIIVGTPHIPTPAKDILAWIAK